MKTKRLFITSCIALLLCFAMMLGTTLAWFTDVVESTGNKIEAGNLQLDLLVLGEDDGQWKSIKDDQDPIFNYQNWEPGYTDITILKVVNLGSLSFKWEARFASENQLSALAKVIDVYVCSGVAESYPANRELDATWKHVGTLDQFVNTLSDTTYGFLDANESATLGIALKMQKTAGNEYQGLTLGEFDIRIVATQATAEDDSFDNLYDEDATWPGDINFETSASLDPAQIVRGELANDFIIRYSDSIYALLPAGVKVAPGAEKIAFSGKSVENGSNITLGDGDSAKSYDIHIEGIAEDNTKPITVYLGALLKKNISDTSLKLYHEDVLMTRVNSVADFAINNQYTYDPTTGEVVFYVNNFSVFSAVKTSASKWEDTTEADTSWYNDEDREFTLNDVADFLGFRNLVDGGNTFAGKTVILATDIDLSNKPFDPIGFGYWYEKNVVEGKDQNTVFMGTFDGGNHTIYNLYENCWELDPDKENYSTYTYSTAGAGLFASIKNATIKNLAVSGAEIVFECVDMGIIVGYAQGECHFENIVVTNAKIANYNRYTGGLVGEVSYGVDNNGDNYSHTFKNVTVDSTVTVSGLWGSFGCGMGGVIGGKWGDATVKMENVVSAPTMDVYNDVVSAYQWYAFRGCGMLIGHTEEPYSDGRHSGNATASFLKCENVKVYYGDWVDQNYYRFSTQTDKEGNLLWYSNYPWVRAEAGEYCDAFSNIRYGIPQIGGVKVTEIAGTTAEELADEHVVITFDQLYGADRGMYGTATHEGVAVFKKNVKTVYIKNNAGWENLKLYYWFANGNDTWTTLIDGVDITSLGENEIYKVNVPAYAQGFKITADGENETDVFYVSQVIDGALYDLYGMHIHEYQWIVDKAPTHEFDGVKHEECTGCHGLRNVNTPIAKLTCTLTKVDANPATCEDVGNEVYYKCDNCDKVYSDEKGYLEIHEKDYEIPALGHKMNADGICDYCGLGTITFQSGKTSNPTEIAPAIVTYKGEVISSLPTPTLSNHTFGGWYLDNACTVPFNEGSTFSASLTLYAKWTPTTNTSDQITILSHYANSSNATLLYPENNPPTGLAIIEANYPDIICVQNAGNNWKTLTTTALDKKGYAASPQNSSATLVYDGDSSGCNVIFYNKDKFNADIGSNIIKFAGTDYYATYIVLERKTDGTLFTVINVWFDDSSNVDDTTRQAQFNAMWNQIYNGTWADKNRGCMPIIVTGSFGNVMPTDSISYQGLTKDSIFVDTSLVAKSPSQGTADKGNYIFASYHMQYTVESYQILTHRNTSYPILVNVALPKVCSHKLTKTEATPVTCNTDGSKEYYTCSICKKVYADEQCTIETTVANCQIPALGHKVGAAATCESAQTCIRCEYEFKPALGHAWTNACDIDCNNSCGATREIIHDYQWVVDTNPTFDAEGVKHEECTVCHVKRSENTPIEKLVCDHEIIKVEAKATTCYAAGNKEYYTCSQCHKVYFDANGYLETTVEERTIPALPHTWVEATCKTPKTCSVCGATEGTVSTEHVLDSNGVCTICGTNFTGTITLKGGKLPYGTYSGDNAKIAATVSGLKGSTISLPTPQMQGHTFEGWYTDYACTTAFNEKTFTNANLTLYAKWEPNTETIKVMSFNVKTDIFKGSRDERVIATIQANNPDVICVQEADWGWMNILNERLPQLGYTAVYANKWGRDGENAGEHTAIFYRTGMFTAVASGTKWLSNTPNTVSKYSYTDANGTTHTSNYPRILTYVVLERKDGGSFLVVNTHLDNNGDNTHDVAEVIRQAEVDIMMQVVKGVTDARGDIPVIITGDFNVIPNNRTAYNAMTKTYKYFDSRIIKKEGDSADTYTYNGMKDDGGSILDYIFVSRHMQNTVQNYNVCDAKLNGEWISDHNAIISTIAVPYVKRTY